MEYKPLDRKSSLLFVRIMGIFMVALGLLVLVKGGERPGGAWSWLLGAIFDIAGNAGLAAFFVALGLALILTSYAGADQK